MISSHMDVWRKSPNIYVIEQAFDIVNCTSDTRINFVLPRSLFQAPGLRRCVEEIVFAFTYPRLDMEVCALNLKTAPWPSLFSLSLYNTVIL